MEIVSIPAFNDNYIWVGVNPALRQAFVVDPGDASPVLTYLKDKGLTLVAILITHKHADHTGGVLELKRQYPALAIYAHPQENLTYVTNPVHDQETFTLAMWPVPFHVLHIPGHTLGHVAYYTKPNLFCGDTLFSAGCGRVFEGTPEQMLSSLEKLAALPNDTLIFCGHEYTLNNLRFAEMVEPENPHIMEYTKSVAQQRAQGEPSLPSTMQIEKSVNPFLRCNEETVKNAAQGKAKQVLPNSTSIFQVIREWKNNF